MKPLLLAALLVAGCAQLSLAPPLTSPKSGGAAWFEASSRNFIVRTDLGASHARELCDELEKIVGAFEDLIAAPDVTPHDRILVVDFARKQDYVEIAKQHGLPNSAGFFAHYSHDIEPLPAIVFSGELDNGTRTILQHELTHRFMALQLHDPPIWLTEGLAEYDSTMLLRNDLAWFGIMPLHYGQLFTPNGHLAVGRGATLRWLTIDDLPTVKSLLVATQNTFLDRVQDDPKPKHPLSYPGAWLLVHMLKSPQLPYRVRFDRFLQLLSSGVNRHAAFSQAFAGVTIEELEQQYRKYATQMTVTATRDGDRWLTLVRTAYQPRAAAKVSDERPLSDARVHLLFLQLRSWAAPYREQARRELLAAQYSAPADPEVTYWNALLALADGKNLEDAERELRQAMQGELREDSRYRFALYNLREGILLHGRPQEQVTPEEWATLDDDAGELAKVAHTATEINNVGWFYALRQQPEVGLPFAMRAVEMEPDCAPCLDTLARLYAQRGQLAAAVQAQERAYSLVPEWANPSKYKQKLDAYRQALAKSAPSPDEPRASPTAAP